VDDDIRVENLAKRYGSTRAVDGISFRVARGEIFGIVGPNGAGKTTTVECLVGLRTPDSGSVSVLGRDPRARGRELREQLGVQLQQAALPDRIRVREALDLFASFYRSPADTRLLQEQWGLSGKGSATFISLSGGQKQRLFIALALVNNPRIVLLDELTTGLDPQARHATWDLVRAIRARGTTVLLVTHFMEEAERLCDRVAVIDHGRIVAMGTPRELVGSLDAGTRIRFTREDGWSPAVLEGVPGVTRVEEEGGEVVVHGGGPLMARVATALAERGIIPGDLRTERATLEDVFLSLTGSRQRD
jgi:ABC-2 type transport system ATP-binding protein